MTDEIQQGSDEWRALRCGKVTASRIVDIMAKTKSGPSASRMNYLAELVAERLTGTPADNFQSSEMRRGNEVEPDARTAYEFRANCDVLQIAFVPHPSIADAGASPDGLVGADGLVEIKCPNTATHIESLIAREAPTKYIKQMQFQMACTGRKWCDFISYDPRMPDHMQLLIVRVKRDEILIAEMEREIRAFLKEVEDKVTALRGIYDAREAAE